MKVDIDCFKTLFSGLAMQGLVFRPISGVRQPQQQHEYKQLTEADEQGDGEGRDVEDLHMTQEDL